MHAAVHGRRPPPGGALLRRSAVFALGLLGLVAVPSHAQLIVGESGIPAGSMVIDFAQFTGGWTSTNGPLEVSQIPGESVTFEGTNTADASTIIGDGRYLLGTNGEWSGRSGVGVNTALSIEFTFNSGLVSFVGFQMNYAPCCYQPVLLEAYGIGDRLLASYNLTDLAPISTPDGFNASEFRGIDAGAEEIRSVRVTGGVAIVDDLTFSRGPVAVPEPGTTLLLLSGLAGLGLASRRRPVGAGLPA